MGCQFGPKLPNPVFAAGASPEDRLRHVSLGRHHHTVSLVLWPLYHNGCVCKAHHKHADSKENCGRLACVKNTEASGSWGESTETQRLSTEWPTLYSKRSEQHVDGLLKQKSQQNKLKRLVKRSRPPWRCRCRSQQVK